MPHGTGQGRKGNEESGSQCAWAMTGKLAATSLTVAVPVVSSIAIPIVSTVAAAVITVAAIVIAALAPAMSLIVGDGDFHGGCIGNIVGGIGGLDFDGVNA